MLWVQSSAQHKQAEYRESQHWGGRHRRARSSRLSSTKQWIWNQPEQHQTLSPNRKQQQHNSTLLHAVLIASSCITGTACASCIPLNIILPRSPASKLPNTMGTVLITSPYHTTLFSWSIPLTDVLNIELSTYSPGIFSVVCWSPVLLNAAIPHKVPGLLFKLPTLFEQSPSFMWPTQYLITIQPIFLT